MALLSRERTPIAFLKRIWPKPGLRREQWLVGYLFLLPDLLGLFVFWAAPMLFLFYLSFHEWTSLGPMTYVGPENFVTLVGDDVFWKSVKVTLIYLVGFAPSVVVLSLALAIVLNTKIKARNWFRTGYFVPYALPMVVAGVIWAFMLSPGFGIVNYVLRQLGLPTRMWLSSVKDALPVVIWVGIWKRVGFYMILFLAGLQEIPEEYYEAAKIDGAHSWQLFRYITLPLLRPVLFFVVLIVGFRAFQVFDEIYVMTHGGPFRATYTLMYFIYERAFTFHRFGYAAAASVVLFAMAMLFTLVQMRYFGTGAVE
jgi:multiple sugar transport system permease protein